MRSGYVGIYNQGSTCYLSSVIQALYHLPKFRNEIYHLPQAEEEPLARSLRNIFAQLDARSTNITTTDLTNAFGWSAQEAAVQHDVHELTQQLFDSLENIVKGTAKETFIRDLFGGLTIYRTKAVDGANYVADRLEDFYDVELVVKGKEHMEDSLQEFVAGERIDGVSVELTPGAKPTVHTIERSQHFLQLPKVLLVHPNRVAFDMTTLELVTLSNAWHFDQSIDLGKYVVDEASLKLDKESQEKMKKIQRRIYRGGKYSLRSILTHAGDANIGHYYVYVNFDGEWVRFNDEIVEASTAEEVARSAFGGQSMQSRYRLFKNERASLLVYVNDDVKDEILTEVPPPPSVLEGARHAAIAQTRRQEARRISYYMWDESIIDVLDHVPGMEKYAKEVEVVVSRDGDNDAAVIDAIAKDLKVDRNCIRIVGTGPAASNADQFYSRSYDSAPARHNKCLFVKVVSPPAQDDEGFVAVVRCLGANGSLLKRVEVVSSRKELAALIPQKAAVYVYSEPPPSILPVKSLNLLTNGSNVIWTAADVSGNVVLDYIDKRQKLKTHVVQLGNYTTDLKELFSIEAPEDVAYHTLQGGIYDALRDRNAADPLPPSEDHIAFFESTGTNSYAFSMPLSSAAMRCGEKYPRLLRDLWGHSRTEHRVVFTVLPIPLSSINLSVLITVNGGFHCQPHVYVPAQTTVTTLTDLVKLSVHQLKHYMPPSTLRSYEEHASGARVSVRLLKVRRGRIVNSVESDDAPINLQENCHFVLDQLAPQLPEHELVNVFFCRRRSGEEYFGLPTNMCVSTAMVETCEVLLKRLVKMLHYPNEADAIKRWILCVKNFTTNKTRTAGNKERLADLVREVGGAPYAFLVDRPLMTAMDGMEEVEHSKESIVIKSSSTTDLSSL